YRVFVGKGAAFEQGPASKLQFADFADGMSNTILVVEAADAVPWTKPEELDYDPDRPLPALGMSGNGFCFATADSAVYFGRKDFDERELRRAMTRNEGEPLDWSKVKADFASPREKPSQWRK